jgi:transketolase
MRRRKMARKDGEDELKRLEETARLVRRHIINMVYEAGSGHPGGSLSATDFLVTLYFHTMKH